MFGLGSDFTTSFGLSKRMWQQGLREGAQLAFSLINAVVRGGDRGSPTRLPNLKVDFVVVLLYAGILAMINWGVRLCVVMPLSRRILRDSSHHGKKLRANEPKAVKLSLCFMEMLFYLAFSYFNFVILVEEVWAWPSLHWWLNFEKKDLATGASLHSFMTKVSLP